MTPGSTRWNMFPLVVTLCFFVMKSVCCKETAYMKSYKSRSNGLTQYLASVRKLGNRRSFEGLRTFSPSHGTNLAVSLMLAGNIEMNPDPRFQYRLCKKYCKTSDKVVDCEDCKKKSVFMQPVQNLAMRR